jgi:hypothetical protein
VYDAIKKKTKETEKITNDLFKKYLPNPKTKDVG